ncbi:LysR family transcriptional regulator [Acinetobacter populi]|jgi:DNA-binding transcriptional LysR family regulator|uniref:LysR family transcriptional regulator n=1 Tax=Acinetobacter populi TaxID=1582270 RepID=A0A1Z9YY81_9GAMM|nr:LysR family transcriptional regulator [Acinetobacter populi]MCH4248370.1 LysR family transcriptional regulator [Acinetobacter populi]OUY07184.1 LysR family transcriptional regulator [Acinetobacter populi]
MLDNLRAMGVFACVVERNSFSGAAKELGITTSAVSQQIRSLEQEMNVTLLHRSTRKISLTEVGQAFYQSCQEMMAAAERGKIRISELQDNLIGELRLATTPELGAMHIVPALSQWMMAHSSLKVRIEAAHHYVDLVDQHIDIAIRMSPKMEQRDDYEFIPMARVEQVLLVSPSYLNQNPPIDCPQDLIKHELLPIDLMTDYSKFSFTHATSGEKVQIEMPVRIQTNNVFVAKTLCQNGHGIARILYLDAQHELRKSELIEILPNWKLPEYILYAVILKREQQPVKITRCIETLKNFFAQLPGGR